MTSIFGRAAASLMAKIVSRTPGADELGSRLVAALDNPVLKVLLLAALQIGCWNLASAQTTTERPTNRADVVRVTPDQMHQLNIAKVTPYPFRLQKPAIGQIAFNEDASTVVLTPFSGQSLA